MKAQTDWQLLPPSNPPPQRAWMGMAYDVARGVSVMAAGPLIVAVAVGLVVGMAVDGVDRKYDLTNRLIAAVDRRLAEFTHEVMKGPREFQRQWWQWER